MIVTLREQRTKPRSSGRGGRHSPGEREERKGNGDGARVERKREREREIYVYISEDDIISVIGVASTASSYGNKSVCVFFFFLQRRDSFFFHWGQITRIKPHSIYLEPREAIWNAIRFSERNTVYLYLLTNTHLHVTSVRIISKEQRALLSLVELLKKVVAIAVSIVHDSRSSRNDSLLSCAFSGG